MSDYARGQETFVSRLVLTINNLNRLLVAALFVGVVVLCLVLHFELPMSFFSFQARVWALAKKKLEMNGLVSIKDSADFIIRANREFYRVHNAAFSHAMMGAAWSSGFFFCSIFAFFSLRGHNMLRADHRRGARLIGPREFNREYLQVMCAEVQEICSDSTGIRGKRATLRTFQGRGFVCGVDRLELPEFALYRHLAVVGATGVGKSTLIKFYLEYCRAGGEKVLIPDINGEYASEFCRPSDRILSLSDQRSSAWTFQTEAEVHPSEFARFLVPSGDERNAFWWKGARQVLMQLLAQASSPEELWARLNAEGADLTGMLTGLPRKIAGKEGSSQAAGITGSSLLDLAFLEHLNYWPRKRGDDEPFSLYRWAQDEEPNWVFITFPDTEREIMGPLLRLWINTALLGLLKRREDHTKPFNLVIDELATIGKIELLTTALERARKYRGKVVLGYQSESQLVEHYGRNGALTIRANTGSRFIFRSPEAREAKELSDYLGQQEVRRKNSGSSYGGKNPGERENISEQETLRNVVLDSEIRDLPDGHFFLKSLNVNPVKSRIRKRRWDRLYEPTFQFPESYRTDRLSVAEPSDMLIKPRVLCK